MGNEITLSSSSICSALLSLSARMRLKSLVGIVAVARYEQPEHAFPSLTSRGNGLHIGTAASVVEVSTVCPEASKMSSDVLGRRILSLALR